MQGITGEITSAMGQATDVLKDAEKDNEKLMDHLDEFKDYLAKEEEAKNTWSEFAQISVGNQEELDAELAQYEKEQSLKEAAEVNMQFDRVPTTNIVQGAPVQIVEPIIQKEEKEKPVTQSKNLATFLDI